jgi:hypothetical protein
VATTGLERKQYPAHGVGTGETSSNSAALQFALATDEFLPTEAGRMSFALLQTADPKAWENLLRNLGVTATHRHAGDRPGRSRRHSVSSTITSSKLWMCQMEGTC